MNKFAKKLLDKIEWRKTPLVTIKDKSEFLPPKSRWTSSLLVITDKENHTFTIYKDVHHDKYDFSFDEEYDISQLGDLINCHINQYEHLKL